MKRFFSVALLSVTLMAVISSCKKGDTGPEGPKGSTGSANVIYSSWFTPATYVKDTVFGTWGFNYNKAAPLITQPVLDSGVVLVFGKLNGYNPLVWATNQVGQLPIVITYQQSSVPYTDIWSAVATVGNIHIRMVDDKDTYGSISNSHQFRYIIIPGGVQAGRTRQMTYEEICQKYNIPI